MAVFAKSVKTERSADNGLPHSRPIAPGGTRADASPFKPANACANEDKLSGNTPPNRRSAVFSGKKRPSLTW